MQYSPMSLPEQAKAKFLGHLPLFLLTIAGAAVRLVGLPKESIWLDEAFSFYMVQNDPTMILERSIGDNSPPLFYLLLRGFTSLFGTTAADMRMPSVLFGITLIPLTYVVGRRMFSRTVGIVAALFVAFSPILVWYSQESRAYAMMAFFALLSFWALVEAVRHQRKTFWWLFAVSTALLFYTHYFAIFFAGLEVVIFFLLWKPRDRTTFRHALLGGLGAFILYLPWLAVFLSRKGGDTGALFWAVTNEHSWKVTLLHLVGGYPNEYLLAWRPQEPLVILGMILVPLLMVTGTFVAIRRGEMRPYVSLLLLAVVPIVSLYLITNIYAPMYHTRFVIDSVPFIFLAVAYALVHFKDLLPARLHGSVSLSWLLGGLILVLMGTTLAHMHTDLNKEDWKGASDYIRENAEQGDAVVFEPRYFFIPFGYYLNLTATRNEYNTTIDGKTMHFYGNDYFYNADIPGRMENVSLKSPRIWRVSASYSPHEIENWLNEHYEKKSTKDFPLLQVTEYRKK